MKTLIAVASAINLCLSATQLAQDNEPREDRDRGRTAEQRGGREARENKENKGLPREYYRSSAVVGKKVENQKGENIGQIEELVIDGQRGQIAYAVVSFGGFLGIGDKFFAVPWNALNKKAGEDTFILPVEKERLEKAPGFDKKDWPDMANAQWAEDIHRFYGQQPYWSGASISSWIDEELRRQVQKEPVQLPLRLREGATYTYRFEKQTTGAAGEGTGAPPAREQGSPRLGDREERREGAAAGDASRRHHMASEQKELRLTVKEAAAEGDATIEVTCTDAATGQARGQSEELKCTVKVSKDGRVSEVDSPGGATKPSETDKQHLMAQLGKIFGQGLHGKTLQPGETVRWTGPTPPPLPGTDPNAHNFAFRYEGVGDLDGKRVARFAIVPASAATGAGQSQPGREGQGTPPREPGSGQPGAGQANQGGHANQAGQAMGFVAYRVDDGILERMGGKMGPHHMRLQRIEAGELGN